MDLELFFCKLLSFLFFLFKFKLSVFYIDSMIGQIEYFFRQESPSFPHLLFLSYSIYRILFELVTLKPFVSLRHCPENLMTVLQRGKIKIRANSR